MSRIVALVIIVLGLFPGIAFAQSAPSCQFVLGFKALHDLIPTIVGNCLDNEQHNPVNGDALQHTTGGLLVWRNADNWTAFTDGYHTWIHVGNGVRERLNTQRFSWEAPVAPDSPDFQTFVEQTVIPLASGGYKAFFPRLALPVEAGAWRSDGASDTTLGQAERDIQAEEMDGPLRVVGMATPSGEDNANPQLRYVLLANQSDGSFSRGFALGFSWSAGSWHVQSVLGAAGYGGVVAELDTYDYHVPDFAPFPARPSFPMDVVAADGTLVSLHERRVGPLDLLVPDQWIVSNTTPSVGDYTRWSIVSPDGANVITIYVTACGLCGRTDILASPTSTGYFDWSQVLPSAMLELVLHGNWVRFHQASGTSGAIIMGPTGGYAVLGWQGSLAESAVADTLESSVQFTRP